MKNPISSDFVLAMELRDNIKSNFLGKGVQCAINNVNEVISPKILGKDVTKQEELDKFMIELDGSENKEILGANAILGISLAICKAGAAAKGIPLYKHIANLCGNKEILLPVPAFNVINGGSHAGNGLAMQEFMVNTNLFILLYRFSLQVLSPSLKL